MHFPLLIIEEKESRFLPLTNCKDDDKENSLVANKLSLWLLNLTGKWKSKNRIQEQELRNVAKRYEGTSRWIPFVENRLKVSLFWC